MKFWIQVMKIWRNSLAPLRTEKQAGSSKRGTSIKYKELHPKTLSLKESLYAFLRIHWEWESNPEYYVRRRHQYPKIRVFWDMILCSLSDMYQCFKGPYCQTIHCHIPDKSTFKTIQFLLLGVTSNMNTFHRCYRLVAIMWEYLQFTAIVLHITHPGTLNYRLILVKNCRNLQKHLCHRKS
jgi:hypothetical protein